MNLKKNQTIELNITDIGVNGEGIGHLENYAFFVKDALPGDRIRAVVTKIKKGYAYAKTTEVLVPSANRIQPPCPAAGRCGGCQIMQLDYSQQLKLKEEKVRNNLQRIGGLSRIPMQPIIGMESPVPLHFRNKMQFPVGRSKEGDVITGFYAGRTHYIIGVDDCPVAAPENADILRVIRDYIQEHQISVYNEETGKGLLRHVLIRKAFATGQIMVCLIINGDRMDEGITEALLSIDLASYGSQITSICLNINKEKTNVILGRQMISIYGNPYIEDRIGELTFRISPLAFFQVNSLQTEKLYAKALEYAGLTGNETVWDLYCGTGTISLFLAQKAGRVFGVEIVPQAIENAKENAELNGIENAEFFCGKSEEVFVRLCGEGEESICPSADVVVLDPPRKGCDITLLEAILKVGPERIVYVSCDSATLARDINILSRDYELKAITPVDMFPHTMHVETVVLMTKTE